MALACINGARECSGCMACQDNNEYFCPKCGEQVFDTVYISNDGKIIGCENCISTKDPYELLEEV